MIRVPTAHDQDKVLVEMDILVSEVMHMDSRTHPIVDTEARHHRDPGEGWEDLVEATDRHLFHPTAKGEDTLHRHRISMRTMASVVLELDMAGHSLNVKIRTIPTAHVNTHHILKGSILMTPQDL
jgi:hypothetical protein